VKGCDGDCCYVLYAPPDSKVKSDVTVHKNNYKLEIFAITKQTVIYFFGLMFQVNTLKILAVTMFNYLLYSDKKEQNPFNLCVPFIALTLLAGQHAGHPACQKRALFNANFLFYRTCCKRWSVKQQLKILVAAATQLEL